MNKIENDKIINYKKTIIPLEKVKKRFYLLPKRPSTSLAITLFLSGSIG